MWSEPGNRKRRTVTVAALAVVLAGVAVSAVVAGRVAMVDEAARLDHELAEATANKLADIPSSDGLPARALYAQVTASGLLCLTDAPIESPTMGGGGCNPVDDPLGGSAISASLAYDGGPAVSDVRDGRISGLAVAETAALRVLMSDGTFRAVKLKKAKVGSDEFQAFGYRFRKADLKKGIGPVAIVAYDGDGNEIGRQPTGIG